VYGVGVGGHGATGNHFARAKKKIRLNGNNIDELIIV